MLKQELLELLKEYADYVETTDGVKGYYRDAKNYMNLQDFMHWLEKGFVEV